MSTFKTLPFKPWDKRCLEALMAALLRRSSLFSDITRHWFRASDGTIIRFIAWSDYSRCSRTRGPRDYYFRLPVNHPLPLGIELVRADHPRHPATAEDREYYTKLYGQLEVGVWTEFTYAKQEKAPPPAPLLLLTWPEEKAS